MNATGTPDTPMEVVNDLLATALKATTLEDMKKGVEKAYLISSGLDPYLDRMLPPVPEACQDLMTASSEHDWAGVYNAVRCSIYFLMYIPEEAVSTLSVGKSTLVAC